jgi:hypothetical protein
MRPSVVLASTAFLLLASVSADASPPAPAAERALSEDAAVAAAAVRELRAQGYAGLDAVLAAQPGERGETSGGLRLFLPAGGDAPASRRWSAAVDAVAGQKDARASRLFWHEDMASATAEAAASGRPILELVMLGRLDEDGSCANSRFFRTVLYANAEVSKALRERFVLVWRSMRPVPKVTIDFGDGRRLERTITGNSAHLVLDPAGRPVDAIPGLYGPKAFLRALDAGEALARKVAGRDGKDVVSILHDAHLAAGAALDDAFRADLLALGDEAAGVRGEEAGTPPPPPTAAEASARAVGKSLVEAPILSALDRVPPRTPDEVDDATWKRLAARHAEDARLDASALTLIREKRDPARAAMALAGTKGRVEDPILRLVHPFERSLAEDTVRNEHRLHRKVHDWFVAGEVAFDAGSFAERIYAELFLTPSSDPWLGLAPSDAYAALEGEGLVTPEK